MPDEEKEKIGPKNVSSAMGAKKIASSAVISAKPQANPNPVPIKPPAPTQSAPPSIALSVPAQPQMLTPQPQIMMMPAPPMAPMRPPPLMSECFLLICLLFH